MEHLKKTEAMAILTERQFKFISSQYHREWKTRQPKGFHKLASSFGGEPTLLPKSSTSKLLALPDTDISKTKKRHGT